MSLKIYGKTKFYDRVRVVVGSNEEIPTSSYSVVFGDGYTDEPITEANEGSYVSLTLETNASNGTEIPYTITGISEQDSTLLLNGVFIVGIDQQRRFTVSEDFLTEGPETMVVTLDGITPTVSAALVINDTSTTPVPTYNLRFASTSDPEMPTITEMNEGNLVYVVLETTNVTEPISYTITGISEEDIGEFAIPITGFFNPGYDHFLFDISNDLLTEGPETMVVTLDGITPTVSAALVINDTSTTPVPTYTAYFTDGSGAPITEVNEGGAGGNVLFRVNTTNVPVDTLIPYTITGISQEDTNLPLTGVLDWTASEDGYFYLGNFDIFTDNLTEGPETMVITLDGITPTVSAALVINDTSTTPVPTYNLYFTDGADSPITEVAEGVFNILLILETTNIPIGTSVPYTITGISQEDIDFPLTGSFSAGGFTTSNNKDGSGVNITASGDLLTEGPETMVVTLDGITPTVSAALVINDTSTE